MLISILQKFDFNFIIVRVFDMGELNKKKILIKIEVKSDGNVLLILVVI